MANEFILIECYSAIWSAHIRDMLDNWTPTAMPYDVNNTQSSNNLYVFSMLEESNAFDEVYDAVVQLHAKSQKKGVSAAQFSNNYALFKLLNPQVGEAKTSFKTSFNKPTRKDRRRKKRSK